MPETHIIPHDSARGVLQSPIADGAGIDTYTGFFCKRLKRFTQTTPEFLCFPNPTTGRDQEKIKVVVRFFDTACNLDTTFAATVASHKNQGAP
jgi:hypothetical protein